MLCVRVCVVVCVGCGDLASVDSVRHCRPTGRPERLLTQPYARARGPPHKSLRLVVDTRFHASCSY
jgi:hypothetical protein